MKSIPKISLLSLAVLSVIVGVLFYVGGDSTDSIQSGAKSLPIPNYTNTLMFWAYILLLISVLITLGVVIYKFISKYEFFFFHHYNI